MLALTYCKDARANSHPSYIKLNCNSTSEGRSKALPSEITIKILSTLLQTNLVITESHQLSVDVVRKTNSGEDFTIINSNDFQLESVNLQRVKIRHNEDLIWVDRETLKINTLQDSDGTTYKYSIPLYDCSLIPAKGI